MNKFVSSLLGAFTGTWIAFFLIGIFIFFLGIAALTSTALTQTTTKVTDNAVLLINLSGEISDKPYNKSLQSMIQGDGSPTENLHDILAAIDEAATNDKIKGICLNCGSVQSGYSIAREIRNAISDFKEASGKWVYAYGDNFSQTDYYIASVADSIFVNPVGTIDIHGLTSTKLYYKGLLDKIGVDVQIIKVGTYKSAVEPYFLTAMSDADRAQTETYINNIWGQIRGDISAGRNVEPDAVQSFADGLYSLRGPEAAMSKGFVDGLCYGHQFESKIRELVGIDQTDDINFVTPYDVANSITDDSSSDNVIAVIYAEGDIVVSGTDETINSADLAPQIVDLANDETIKGLVLRVNSPGGSAYASEQIWEAIDFFKSKQKPVAISMGNYAASGGYYISCGANRIFAEPTTITGSIGIFGMIPSVKKLMNDNLGITADFVSTSDNCNISPFEPLTPVQTEAFQNYINEGYELFVSRCANGRNMPIDSIKAIAEGRVWDGKSAIEIGLVDEYGGIGDAVEWVADNAKVTDDYRVDYYPQYTEDFFNLLYKSLETSLKSAASPAISNELMLCVEKAQSILGRDKIQCRMEDIYIH